MSTFKVYENQNFIKNTVSAIRMDDMESFKLNIEFLIDDLNGFPIYLSDSSKDILIGETHNASYEKYGSLRGYGSILDYLLESAVYKAENKDYSDIIEALFLLGDIDYSKLVQTIRLLSRKNNLYLLDIIVSNHNNLDTTIIDYTSHLGLGRTPFGVPYSPLDDILSGSLNRCDNDSNFEFAKRLAHKYSYHLTECKSVINFIIEAFDAETHKKNQLELAEFLGNIFLENDDYIDHIPRKAIDSYLKKIRNQKTWSIYFSKLTSILPNDHLYGATIRIYSIREQYNLLDELLGIYDEEYLISQLRLYSNRHVYREYVKYMVNCKNDLSEFYFAYNRYTGGRTSPLSISGSELECILNSYLINLYEKKDYTKIKIIIDSYNIYACFMESFLKLLIKSNDLFGLKYILKSHNSLVVTRDFNMITELISFAKEINVDKDIVKYLNSVSKVSVGSLVKSFAKEVVSDIKAKKELRNRQLKEWS